MARPKAHETFLYRVFKQVRPTTKGCVEFFGYLSDDGYGRINKDGNLVYIHREIYRHFKADFDKSLSVCHHCDNPCCVNHNHLFLGTHKQNMEDKARKGRVTNVVGGKNPSAKLQEKDIPIIRERIKNGITCYQIAREYGVKGETILSIKNGRTWRHVE